MRDGQGRRTRGRWRQAAVALVVAIAGPVLVAAPPVAAAVTSISPSSVTVDPGGVASATVRVNIGDQRASCPAPTPSSGAVFAEIEPRCSDGEPLTLQVATDPDIAPGTYTVRVEDGESGQTFTLRVRAPAPAPTAPPSTVAQTTTTSSTTTTRAPASSTSTPPTAPTTVESTTSTAPLPTVPVGPGGFVSVAALIDAGLPPEGLFLPLADPRFLTCLPLTTACADDGGTVLLVPARTSDVRWQTGPGATGEDATADADADADDVSFTPVGSAPADAPGAFLVPVLDLSTGTPRSTQLVRSLSSAGRLVPGVGDGDGDPATAAPDATVTAVSPTAVGPLTPAAADPAPTTTVAATAGPPSPFGAPRSARSALFSEASPALVLVPDGRNRVVQALRPDPAWDLGVDLIPLFDGRSLPYLVRGVEGPAGLFVPSPQGASVPPLDQTSGPPATGDGGSPPPLLLLAGGLAAGVGLTVLAARRRRPDGPSTPPGT